MRVILRTKFPERRQMFNGTVNIQATGETYQITQDLFVYKSKVPKEGMAPWALRMDSGRTLWAFEYKEKHEKGWSEAVDWKKEHAISIIAQHEKVECLFGTPNKNLRGEALFTLEYEGHRNTSFADLNILKNQVFNKYLPMGLSEKADVAFYYGVNAVNLKKHSEHIVKMADFQNGILMQDIIPMGETMSPMRHFLNKYGKENITVRKLVTQKAIIYQLIQKNEKGYFFEQEYIGNTPENVYTYLEINPQIMEFLQKEINNRDKTIEDDMVEQVIPADIRDKKFELKDFTDEKMLRDCAQKLDIGNWHNKKIDKIENEIREIARQVGVPLTLGWIEMTEAIEQKKLAMA